MTFIKQNILKHILLFILITSASQYSKGQENVFLLFNQLPIILNPAFTGSGCGVRTNVYYQNLSHNTSHSTFANNQGLTLDLPLKFNNNDKVGLGYKMGYDVSGSSNFTNFSNHLLLAYHKSLSNSQDRPSYIALGLEGGIVSNSLKGKDLRWPSQIGPNGFDPNLPPNEMIDFSIKYFDLNLGLSWSGYLHQKVKSTIGIAIIHINTPIVSFLGSKENTLKQRIVTHFTSDITLNKKWFIIPAVYYTNQGSVYYYMFSSNIGHKFSNHTSVSLGGGYAKNSQPFVNVLINYEKINIGVAYGFENRAGLNKLEVILGYSLGDLHCKK